MVAALGGDSPRARSLADRRIHRDPPSAGQDSALFATRGYDEREHGHSHGNDATDIEQWDGTSWVPLPPFWDTDRQWLIRINAIAVGPDGDLFMTTGSIIPGSVDLNSALARWNGEHWSAMAAWPAPYYDSGGNFTALAVCPDEAVYTSARIQGADGGEKQGILRWDGESWAMLDGKGGCTWSATALACDGDGQVYGHVSCGDWSGVAHWSGNDWNPLGDGLNTKDSPAVVSVDVSTLVVDAAGRLYAARVVADTLRDRVSSVLRWDGRQWEALGARVNGEVRSMAVGPGSLWVGGLFTVVDGVAAAGMAKWVDPSISPVALEPNSISEEAPDLPLTVESPFPNPFRSQARLRYRTRSTGPLRVMLYDLLGRRLSTLYDGDAIAGQRGEVFVNGSGLPGGTYVVRFETVGTVVAKVVQLAR